MLAINWIAYVITYMRRCVAYVNAYTRWCVTSFCIFGKVLTSSFWKGMDLEH